MNELETLPRANKVEKALEAHPQIPEIDKRRVKKLLERRGADGRLLRAVALCATRRGRRPRVLGLWAVRERWSFSHPLYAVWGEAKVRGRSAAASEEWQQYWPGRLDGAAKIGKSCDRLGGGVRYEGEFPPFKSS